MRLKVYNPGQSGNLLVYINPGFNKTHGHYLMQLRALEEGAKQGLFGLCHLVHLRYKWAGPQSTPLTRIFKFTPEVVKYGTSEEIDAASENFYLILKKLTHWLKKKASNFENIRFYQFTSHPHYEGIYEQVLEESKLLCDKVKVVSNHLYREDENERISPSEVDFETSVRKANRTTNSRWIRSTTDSITYYEAIKKEKDFQLEYLPFPLPDSAIPSPSFFKSIMPKFSKGNQPQSIPEDKIGVCYFGYPFNKWGYQDAYELYRSIVIKKKLRHFWFSIRHQNVHGDPLGYELKSKWIKERENISHYEGYLPERAYTQILDQADIVLLPYLPKMYRYATSGVFIEAVIRKKVVITTKDTWMARELKSGKCGKTYVYGTVEELAQCLEEAGSDIKEETAKMDTLSLKYKSSYSVASFSEQLFNQ